MAEEDPSGNVETLEVPLEEAYPPPPGPDRAPDVALLELSDARAEVAGCLKVALLSTSIGLALLLVHLRTAAAALAAAFLLSLILGMTSIPSVRRAKRLLRQHSLDSRMSGASSLRRRHRAVFALAVADLLLGIVVLNAPNIWGVPPPLDLAISNGTPSAVDIQIKVWDSGNTTLLDKAYRIEAGGTKATGTIATAKGVYFVTASVDTNRTATASLLVDLLHSDAHILVRDDRIEIFQSVA